MPPRTEQELLDQTVELARICRWAVTHARPARTSKGFRTAIQGHPGAPDLLLARNGVVWLWELKGPTGRLTSEQRDWARQLGQFYRLLRPADWDWMVSILTERAVVPVRSDEPVPGDYRDQVIA